MITPIDDFLNILALKDGSDLYLSTGAPPCAKFAGSLKTLSQKHYTAGEVADIAYAIMDDRQKAEFEEELEMNLALSIHNVGRFRINIFKQRNEISIVAKNIITATPKFNDLKLPQILKEIIMEKHGLILVVGGTRSGKSTSLAALIDHRNSSAGGHIITIEDPVEFVHRHKKSVVNQREVGVDTRSFKSALKNALRQAPDVILIGEIRDLETMEYALQFAEAGRLAISTLYASNVNQALEYIINMFPEERRDQLTSSLSQNIKAIVAQRLIPTVDNKRCAAVEVLLGDKTIQELILQHRFHEIKDVMEKSEKIGMQTLDSALFRLFEQGRITFDEAITNAESPNNLRLRIKLTIDCHGQATASTLPALNELTLEALEQKPRGNQPAQLTH